MTIRVRARGESGYIFGLLKREKRTDRPLSDAVGSTDWAAACTDATGVGTVPLCKDAPYANRLKRECI